MRRGGRSQQVHRATEATQALTGEDAGHDRACRGADKTISIAEVDTQFNEAAQIAGLPRDKPHSTTAEHDALAHISAISGGEVPRQG